jgi:hypothetical protein
MGWSGNTGKVLTKLENLAKKIKYDTQGVTAGSYFALRGVSQGDVQPPGSTIQERCIEPQDEILSKGKPDGVRFGPRVGGIRSDKGCTR